MSVRLLKSGLIILIGGAVFSSIAASNGISIHPPFQRLPDTEEQNLIFLLENSRMSLNNGIDSRIQGLSATYQIPVKIIRHLENISRLKSDRLNLTTYQRQLTTLKELNLLSEPTELDQEEWEQQIRFLQDPSKSPYRETERSAAIRILGVIGGKQKMPADTVYYLRSLMFEMENPNIRNSVVHAFMNMVLLHPPDSKTMQKLATWMKKLRETNKKITTLRDRHSKLREQYEQEGKSLPEIIEEIKLPPPLIGGLSENSHIYEIVNKIAQKHFLPEEVIRELGLALEGDENKPSGNSDIIILADNLLDALFAVAKRQGLPDNITSRLKELDTHENYSSNDAVTPNDILTTPIPCQRGFAL